MSAPLKKHIFTKNRIPLHQILKKTLEPIIPNPKDWPIYKISQHKDAFLNEVKNNTRNKILAKVLTEKELNDVLGKVLYAERIRLTQNNRISL